MGAHKVAPVALVAVLAGQAWGQSVDLSYRWNVGATGEYRTTVAVLQEGGRGSSAPDTEIKTVSLATHEVVGVGADPVTGETLGEIEISTTQVQVDADLGPGGQMTFDSNRRADRRRMDVPLVAAATYLLDKSFVITQQASGAFRGVEGYDELVEDVLAKIEDRQARRLLEASIESFVYVDQLGVVWGMALGHEAEVGTTWKVKRTRFDPALGEISVTMNYSLDSVELRDEYEIAVISAKGEIELVDVQLEGVQVEVVTSSIQGDIRFDTTLGMLERVDLEQVMVLELRQGRQRERQTITTNTLVELLEFANVEVTVPREDAGTDEPEVEDTPEPAPEPVPDPAPAPPKP